MPKRPVGVILVAVLLGLISCVLVLLAVSTAAALHLLPSPPVSATGGPAPPSPAFLKGMLVMVSALYLALAGWAVTTLVGLLKLKNWARYCVLTMGGLLAFLGLSSLAMLAVLPAILAATPSTQTMPAGVMHGVLVAVGLFYGGMLALGVWWLVYFNLRSVKSYFLSRYADQRTFAGVNPYQAARNSYLPSRSARAASLATPGGLEAYADAAMPAPLPLLPEKTHAPTPIIVIGCVFLLSCLCCSLFAFVPLPAFLLGFILTGPAVPLLYGVLAVLSGYIGFGMLKLWNGARLATFGFLGFGAVNLVVSLTPWYRGQFLLYQAQMNARIGLSADPTRLQQKMIAGPFYAVLVLLAVALYGVVFWLLQRYRGAFVNALR